MSEATEHRKLDLIVQLNKETYKMCKAMINYFSNSSVEVEQNFRKTEKQLDELKNEVQKLDRLRAAETHVYTDEELAKLKMTMSWNGLHTKTKIPVSTLQYRLRRYRNETGTKEDLNNA